MQKKKNGQSFLSASFTWKKGVQQNNKFIVNIINFSIEVTSILMKLSSLGTSCYKRVQLFALADLGGENKMSIIT